MIIVKSITDYYSLSKHFKKKLLSAAVYLDILRSGKKRLLDEYRKEISKDKESSDETCRIIESILKEIFWNGYFFDIKKSQWLKSEESSIVVEKERLCWIDSLLEQDECENLEFKRSFIYNYETLKKDTILQKEAIMEIAAFLNTTGGVLLIGIKDDDKSVDGIEIDYQFVKNGNWDGFLLALKDKIRDYLGNLYYELIKIKKITKDNKTICAIEITPSQETVYFKEDKDDRKTIIVIRAHNSKRILSDAREIIEFNKKRIPKESEEVHRIPLDKSVYWQNLSNFLTKQYNENDNNFPFAIPNADDNPLYREGLEWYNKGQELLNLGRDIDAVDCFNKALQFIPDLVSALVRKATCLRRLGDHNVALSCVDEALKKESDNVIIWFEKGLCLFELERYEYTLECFNKVIELNLDYSDIYWWTGLTLSRLHKYDEALTHIEKAVKASPKNWEIYELKGQCLRKLGKNKLALKCFSKAIKLNPMYFDLWFEMGETLYALKEYDKALECFEQVTLLVDDPGWYYWYLKGCTYNKLKKYEKALPCFEKTGSDDAMILIEKGYAFLGLLKPIKASKYFEKATKTEDETDPYNYFDVGLCYLDFKYFEKALYFFNESLDVLIVRIGLDDDMINDSDKYNDFYSEIFYHRGLVFDGLKRYSDALESCLEAMKYNQKNKLIKKKITELQKKINTKTNPAK
jgi:tetratricopeptide (TPR) repeat protein